MAVGKREKTKREGRKNSQKEKIARRKKEASTGKKINTGENEQNSKENKARNKLIISQLVMFVLYYFIVHFKLCLMLSNCTRSAVPNSDNN